MSLQGDEYFPVENKITILRHIGGENYICGGVPKKCPGGWSWTRNGRKPIWPDGTILKMQGNPMTEMKVQMIESGNNEGGVTVSIEGESLEKWDMEDEKQGLYVQLVNAAGGKRNNQNKTLSRTAKKHRSKSQRKKRPTRGLRR
jgi:hypothetical protein